MLPVEAFYRPVGGEQRLLHEVLSIVAVAGDRPGNSGQDFELRQHIALEGVIWRATSELGHALGNPVLVLHIPSPPVAPAQCRSRPKRCTAHSARTSSPRRHEVRSYGVVVGDKGLVGPTVAQVFEAGRDGLLATGDGPHLCTASRSDQMLISVIVNPARRRPLRRLCSTGTPASGSQPRGCPPRSWTRTLPGPHAPAKRRRRESTLSSRRASSHTGASSVRKRCTSVPSMPPNTMWAR